MVGGAVDAEPASGTQSPVKGYLDPELAPQGLEVIPPPPKRGSPQAKADLALFTRTRRLQGSDRWRLAQRDVTESPLDTFACALGVQLKPGDAPALDRLLSRLGADRGPWVDAGKFHYMSRRPYLVVKGPICEPKTDHLKGNPDYPSGHAAAGWSIAIVLAELAPDRAGEILARGRVFTESRFICGSHSKSAVDAGVMLASALVATEHGSEPFRSDVAAARADLQAARGKLSPKSAAQCSLETAAMKTRGD